MKKIIILGTGGNCVDIYETLGEINDKNASRYNCLGFLDDNENLWGNEVIDGKCVLGPLSDWKKYEECHFVNGIGSVKTFLNKEKILKSLTIPSHKFETVIHPTASVSRSAIIGRGAVLFQNVVVTSRASIGRHVMILPNSVISHDSEVGDYSTIAGCVCVSGNVIIGKSCYLGSNSTLKDGVKIAPFCLVGSGTNVIRDTNKQTVVVGNPATMLREIL